MQHLTYEERKKMFEEEIYLMQLKKFWKSEGVIKDW